MPETGWLIPSLPILALQSLAAVVSVRLVAKRIAPYIERLGTPATVLDSLGPFALALPMVAAGWRVEADAAQTGWITIGAPITIALLAFGAALVSGVIVSARSSRDDAISPLAFVAWSGVGVLLLLLGASNHLTVWIGQCMFATGAVILWMNTPEVPREDPNATESQVGGAVTISLLAALVHAAAFVLLPARALPIAAGIVIAQATMVVVLFAVVVHPNSAIRIGTWTATYGVLLGLGVISLRHMIPQTINMAWGALGAGGAGGAGTAGGPWGAPAPPHRIAHGFSAFAFEATILIALGAAAVVIDRLHARFVRLALGAIIIVAAATIVGWRLAG